MSQLKRYSTIILASSSPRRRFLLETAGINITVIPSDFEEAAVEIEDPPEYVQTLAEGKARAVARKHPDNWVIGADTIVVIGEQILGKPDSVSEAQSMLRMLSGQTHQVYTGWCLHRVHGGYHFSEAVKTDVEFKNLTPSEIEWYVHTGEPFDKAGSYAIQGLGTFLVRGISGSYSNVVGLPVCEVVEHLLQLEIIGLDPGTRNHN